MSKLTTLLEQFAKEIYFNGRTDAVAEENGVVPKGSPHALSVIQNKIPQLEQEIRKVLEIDQEKCLIYRSNYAPYCEMCAACEPDDEIFSENIGWNEGVDQFIENIRRGK